METRTEPISSSSPPSSSVKPSAGAFSVPLHGLRGVAVLIVLLSHLGNADMSLLPVSHEAIGKAGVWVFFALSSFLLTRGLYRSLLKAQSKSQALASYTINRFSRIYPLYFFVLLLHGLLGNLSANGIVDHLILQAGMNELWAIPVEFQYYLVIPVVALAAIYGSPRIVMGILLVLLAASFGAGLLQPESVYSIELGLLPKASPFLLGSLLALHVEDAPQPRQQQTAPCGFLDYCLTPGAQLGLWSMLLMAALLYRETTTRDLTIEVAALLSMMMAVASVGLIQACLHASWTARMLRAKPLVFLGEISFSLYLLHMFVINAFERWGGAMPSGVQAWLVMAICIPISVVTYRLIEQPGIKAGRMLGEKLGVMPARA